MSFFEGFLRDLYSDKYLRWNDPVPSKLYHYTSFEAALNILDSKTIFLTHTDIKNDPTEVTVCIKALIEILEDRINSSNVVGKIVLSRMLDLVERYYYRYISLENMKKKEKLEKNFYSFSLSEKYDDLSQWRRYGNNGKGACLCFDLSDRFLKSGLIDPSFCQWQIRMGQVKYDFEDSIFHQIVSDHLDYIVKYFNLNDEPSNINLYSGYVVEKLINQISLYKLASYKGTSFVEEQEWKLFHVLDKCNFGRLTNISKTGAEYNVFKFNLSGDEKLPIIDFKLGPNNTDEEKLVENSLNKHDYGQIISKSKVSYRLN